MIKQFSIKNFRGIQDILIPNLGKVNVFLGKNNSGKSSILDAVYLSCFPTHPEHFVEINNLRGYNSIDGEDFKLNFFNRNTQVPIVFHTESDHGSRVLSIYNTVGGVSEFLITDGDTSRLKNKDYALIYTLLSEDGQNYNTSIFVDHKEPQVMKLNVADDYPGTVKVRYLTPATPYRDVSSYFVEAVQNKQEKKITEVLHKIDSRINDIVIAGKEILVDIGSEQRIPLQLMGDGMRKVFSTIVNISTCRDGILLIDEIDNGLHYTSLGYLWKAIIECAYKFNVQVFATTHNIESLASLSFYLESSTEKHQKDFRAYTIRQLSDGTHKAILSGYTQFHHTINHDLELR